MRRFSEKVERRFLWHDPGSKPAVLCWYCTVLAPEGRSTHFRGLMRNARPTRRYRVFVARDGILHGGLSERFCGCARRPPRLNQNRGSTLLMAPEELVDTQQLPS
jgi:hypothetical protein